MSNGSLVDMAYLEKHYSELGKEWEGANAFYPLILHIIVSYPYVVSCIRKISLKPADYG